MLHAQIKGRIARSIEERVRHLSTPLAFFQKGGVWTLFLFNLEGGGAGGGVICWALARDIMGSLTSRSIPLATVVRM